VAHAYRATMAEALAEPDGVFLIDDTTFPKAGRHSVGVQRQYCGALGKKANCQCAVSVHYAASQGHGPLALRLFLPTAWQEDPARLDRAGVPPEERRALSKGDIALELLDQVRAEGWPGQVVVADCGYGVSEPFREALATRGLHYVVGVTDRMVVFTEPPQWEQPDPAAVRTRSRPRTRARLTEASPQALTLAEVAARTPLRRVTWRAGTKRRLSARFGWVRVWSASGWVKGECAGAHPHWLLIEQRDDGSWHYAFSNLPATTSCRRAVRLWHRRWAVEQGYQQMKEELGLDHFEGRSWHGFHRHATLVMLAYGFLTLERLRAQAALAPDGRSPKKRARPRGGSPRAAADLAGGASGASAALATGLSPAVPVLPNPRGKNYLTEY
jgi:SRSO17 transposase